jgi:CMP-N-acetylneuraminic acid synthetase/quercetin dioxygenase-like cupin family protein
MRIVAMIPARVNSKRIPMKNLRYLGDKPLVSHVLETARRSQVFDEVYLNSDDVIFSDIATQYGVSFYHRPSQFAAPHVTNDLFMEDFLKKIECDYVIQLNPTSPFLTVDDIRGFKEFMIGNGHHTVQGVKAERIEGLFAGNPLNFDPTKIMPESQHLTPVMLFSSGIMGFNRDTYFDNMRVYGAATYGGSASIGYYELTGYSTIDIDYEDDFRMAEIVDAHLRRTEHPPARYFSPAPQAQPLTADADRERILVMDGVKALCMNEFNQEVAHVPQLLEKYGTSASWSHTLVNSPSNSATLIAQLPGEGNRLHFHPDWDEWWYIIEGEWEWLVDGEPKPVRKGDLVFIERNRKHRIKAKGDRMAIRLAVSRADVDHVYTAADYS